LTFTDQLADAIALYESGGNHEAISYRNNNPGNLRTWGNLPTAGGFAVFPTYAEGYNALRRQIELNTARGLNLNEFFAGKPGTYAGYAPAADNNRPATYAATVAQWLGIDPAAPLAAIAGSSSAAPIAGSTAAPIADPAMDLTDFDQAAAAPLSFDTWIYGGIAAALMLLVWAARRD
jgi:hypothetical protein